MQKRTKIIATLGPASDAEEKIEGMIREGVSVFRFNMKHGDMEWHKDRIKRVQQVADRIEQPIGILIDLQGFEIRIETREEKEMTVKKGDVFVFGNSFENEEADAIIPQDVVFESLSEGDTFLIDDGSIKFTVKEKRDGMIFGEVKNGGVVKHKKSMNIPGKHINISSIIDSDLKKLDSMAEEKVDFVTLSFARSKEDVEMLRKELEERNIEAAIVAKIESEQALRNIDEIIEVSDVVMIARGDLGVEIPIGELAFWQRKIINKCRLKRKAVIVATQMLYSMIDNPRPTRAEATDVANAVFNGTDAVMLSEETAMGRYAVEVITAMKEILAFNEQFDVFEKVRLDMQNPTDFIINSAAVMTESRKLKTDMAVVFTQTGYSAKTLSTFRLPLPIVAITDSAKTAEILTLYYGVTPIHFPSLTHEFQSSEFILERLKEKGVDLPEDTMIIIHGQHKKQEEPTKNALTFVTLT